MSSNNEKRNMRGIKLLSEAEIQTRQEDEFRHQYYVDILKDILKDTPTPFCIGLFGKWGTGKTGIAGILEKEVKTDLSHQYEVVYFDVWKHSDDTLRRQLLIEIDNKIFGGNFKYSEELYASRTRIVPGKPKFHLVPFLIIFAVFFATLLTLFFIVKQHLYSLPFGLYTSLLINGLISAVIGFLGSFKSFLEIRTEYAEVAKPTSPEEFEERFTNQVLKDNRFAKKQKRLLIIFDNLDRCESDIVLNTLRGISTFLGKERCVYVIPCDPEAIKKHLRSKLYGEDQATKDPDEFLRKLFQITIDIHPLMYTDIRAYADKMIQKTNLGEHPRKNQIVHILTQGFVENPRRIKQFLNNLTIRCIMAKKFETENTITAGVISDNIDFLGKLLVIKEEWSVFYGKMLEDPDVYSTAAEVADSDFKVPESDRVKSVAAVLENTPGLLRFLKGTRAIHHEDVGLFLRFNQDPLEITVSESKKLRHALLYIKYDELATIFEKAKGNDARINEYFDVLQIIVRQEECYPERLAIAVNGLVRIVDLLPEKRRQPFANHICYHVSRSDVSAVTRDMDLGVFKIFRFLSEDNRYLQSILREFFRIAQRSDKFPEDYLRTFTEYPTLFSKGVANELKRYFEQSIQRFKTETLDFCATVEKDAVKKKFFSKHFVKETLQRSITERTNDDNQKTINAYLSLRSILPLEDRNLVLVDNMIQILNAQSNVDGYNSDKEFAIKNLEKVADEIPEEKVESLWNSLKKTSEKIKPQYPHPIEALFKVYLGIYPQLEDKNRDRVKRDLFHLVAEKNAFYEKILSEIQLYPNKGVFYGLVSYLSQAYVSSSGLIGRPEEEQLAFVEKLSNEFYDNDIKILYECVFSDFLSSQDEKVYHIGLVGVKHYHLNIKNEGLSKELMDKLVERINSMDPGTTRVQEIELTLECILIFAKDIEDIRYVDEQVGNIVSSFAKAGDIRKRQLIHKKFKDVKEAVSEKEIKDILGNLVLHLKDQVMGLSIDDPYILILLENQDFLEEDSVVSIENNLRRLLREDKLEQKRKAYIHLPKIEFSDKEKVKEYLSMFLNVLKNPKKAREEKELAKNAIRELEPQVDKKWREWQEFKSLSKESETS